MPLLTPSPPPQYSVVVSLQNESDTPLAQGPIARLLHENLQNVHRHWQDRTPIVEDDDIPLDLDLIDELNSYNAPKFKIVGKRIVKYVKTKPLPLRQIDWDFEDIEDFE